MLTLAVAISPIDRQQVVAQFRLHQPTGWLPMVLGLLLQALTFPMIFAKQWIAGTFDT